MESLGTSLSNSSKIMKSAIFLSKICWVFSTIGFLSLHSSQVAHQAGAYPGFRSMKQLRVFLLPPGWDASPSQGYPQH